MTRFRRYEHGPCPSCKGATARHLGFGRFRCMGVGCNQEFTGREKRRSRLKPRNDKRAAKAKAEDFGGLAELVRAIPCVVEGCGKGPRHTQAHHVVSRGANGKAFVPTMDYEGGEALATIVGNLVPLCHGHHHEGHARGWDTFNDEHEFVVRLPGGSIGFDTIADCAEHIGKVAITRGLNPVTNTWGER